MKESIRHDLCYYLSGKLVEAAGRKFILKVDNVALKIVLIGGTNTLRRQFIIHKLLMSKLRKCVGKENLQRLNYLYQVGNFYAKSDSKQSNLLSMYYANLMISISKKTVQRIEPNLKRRTCKICKSMFIPGKNCKIRIKRRRIQYTCGTCSSSKTYTTHESYLWLDQPESVNETLDYSQNKK